jgi:hypothetical protein
MVLREKKGPLTSNPREAIVLDHVVGGEEEDAADCCGIPGALGGQNVGDDAVRLLRSHALVFHVHGNRPHCRGNVGNGCI